MKVESGLDVARDFGGAAPLEDLGVGGIMTGWKIFVLVSWLRRLALRLAFAFAEQIDG
jgi:hypothetical protein